MSASIAQSPTPGFANPVRDAQLVFRAVLEALARPTAPQRVDAGVRPPAPLSAAVGAVVLALCDEQTPIWLDPALRAAPEVGAWIAFHTGARVVDSTRDALFAIASSPSAAPRLSELALGTDEEPHRSATVVIDVRGARRAGPIAVSGPGVQGVVAWDGDGLPAGFLEQWQQNRAIFPRGVDVILAAETSVRGLPRTTALIDADRRPDEQRSA
jgi:alpha-D-ribose 1-methylphosphonate 5-triphosphate synthase subunit PhnH